MATGFFLSRPVAFLAAVAVLLVLASTAYAFPPKTAILGLTDGEDIDKLSNAVRLVRGLPLKKPAPKRVGTSYVAFPLFCSDRHRTGELRPRASPTTSSTPPFPTSSDCPSVFEYALEVTDPLGRISYGFLSSDSQSPDGSYGISTVTSDRPSGPFTVTNGRIPLVVVECVNVAQGFSWDGNLAVVVCKF